MCSRNRTGARGTFCRSAACARLLRGITELWQSVLDRLAWQRSRPSPGRPRGSGGEAAWRLERALLAGLRYRAAGRCIAADGDERAHERRGHDAGCAALGISLASLERFNAFAGGGGIDRFLDEAIAAAVRHIASDPAGGHSEGAAETVEFEIARRITPRMPAAGPEAVARRPRRLARAWRWRERQRPRAAGSR